MNILVTLFKMLIVVSLQNCQILLSRLKTSNEDLAKAVLSMDKEGELSVEMLEQVTT